VSVYNTAVQIL